MTISTHSRLRTAALTCALVGTLAATPLAPTRASAAVSGPAPASAPTLAAGETVRGVARFDAVPTASQVAALQDLGLVVQPMKALPLALVEGTTAQFAAATTRGIALDVRPDETLAYDDTASSNEMSSSPTAAQSLRARGFTGKGVTVGVVDSGCDATHPDLADHVTHNVILVSGEYANQAPNEGNTLVVPVDQGPYNNTDLGSGHGTHVAGIIAADGTSGAGYLGVAPDAKLACFGIGAVITTTAVVTAYDYMLRQPGHLGIDVVNNSWGNSFRQYDPADPVNIATKAATKAGITVVFSAGNSGAERAEASVSPFNQAPWVISVAASDLDRRRGDFSSNGLRWDNTAAVPIGSGGHTVAFGDRIGIVHPDVSAPGVSISSSCDSTGTVIGPCPDHGNDTASGTSMSSPHVAGAAAVLLQAQPQLTPAQVRMALQATASPVTAAVGTAKAPFREVGYGHVNLDRAVDLVRGDGWRTRLAEASAKADRRVRASDGVRVLRSDTWQYDAPVLAVGGSDEHTYRFAIGTDTSRLHLTLVYPTPGTAANLASYTATLIGPNGAEMASTTTSIGYSTGTATLTAPISKAGTYRVRVTGDYAVSDPDTIDSDSVNGRVVYVNATQVRAQ